MKFFGGSIPPRDAFYNFRKNHMKPQMSLYDFHRLLASFSYFYPKDFYRLFYTVIAVKRIKCNTVPKISCTFCGKRLSRRNKTGLCANCFNQTQVNESIERKKNKEIILCTKCGSQITSSSKTGFCQSCVSKEKRQKLPSKDIILKDLENLSQVEIGKKYGVHPNSLDKYFKRNNINMNEVHRLKRIARGVNLVSNYPSKDDLIQDLKTMLPKEVAKKYNTSNTVVYKWTKHHKIYARELRGRKGSGDDKKLNIIKEKVIPSKDDLIRDLETMKRAEIAKKYKFSYYNMCRLFHQYNIEV